MSVLATYIAQRPVGRDTPSLDRLMAVLDERPDATRTDLMRWLGLSYMGVLGVLQRGKDLGWVEETLTPGQGGKRSTWTYRTRVPDKVAMRRRVLVDTWEVDLVERLGAQDGVKG